MPAPSSHLPEEGEFVVDSGASMHMLSKKGLELRCKGHFEEVQTPNSGRDGQWGSENF